MKKAWYTSNSFEESTESKKKGKRQKGELDSVDSGELYHFYSILIFGLH